MVDRTDYFLYLFYVSISYFQLLLVVVMCADLLLIIIIIISEHLYSALSFREISSLLDALSVRIEQKAFKITLKRVQGKRFVFEVRGKTVPC